MFVKIPIVRGFTEIAKLYEFASQNNIHICGGYARFCASPKQDPKPAGDVDLFPQDMESFNSAKARFESDGLTIKGENEVSITYDTPEGNYWFGSPQIQLIKPVKEARIVTYGSIEEILDNFDFSITRAAIISHTEALVDPHFEEDEKKNNIRILNIHCPISSLFRCIKYIKKGYWLAPAESIKLFQDWTDRDEDYRQKLITYMDGVEKHKESGVDILSEEELFHMERLMMID